MNAIDILGYDYEVTTVNGCCVERFYTADGRIVRSEVLYQGTSEQDANNNLLAYWEEPRRWYVSNGELLHVRG